MLKNSIILISEPVPFWNYFNSVGKFFLLTDFAQLFTFFVFLFLYECERCRYYS